jgi:hypothetical protein
MSTVGESLAIGALGMWLAVTVLGQLPGRMWQGFRRRVNFLGLLPFWGFFTSRLCTKDYHLCWRPASAGGQAGEWREIGAHGPRPPGSALWHPQRRERKALLDLALALVVAQAVERLDESVLRSSPVYGTLQELSHGRAKAEHTASFQFAVLASHGRGSDRPRSVYFLSAVHDT